MQSVADVRAVHGAGSDNASEQETTGAGIMPNVKDALEQEIDIFTAREKLIFHFKVTTQALYLIFLVFDFIIIT